MKRSNRLVILVGVLLAVLAFVAIVILLNQRGSTETPVEEVRETVLVATQDIAIGDPVTPDLVEEQEVPPEAVQGTPLTSTTAVSGQPALFAIPSGSQVTSEAIGLTTSRDICIACQLEPGQKAISFQVDRVTGLDFLITPGDYIDVVFAGQVDVVQETADSAANADEAAPPRFEAVPGLEDQRTVKAILQDKRVLYVSSTRAIDPEPVDSDGDGVPDEEQPAQAVVDSVIIVFAGSAQDAEIIKFAQRDLAELGQLSAIVRHLDDDAIETTLGITFDQLVSEFGVRIPDIVQQLNEEAAP
ncbi:MAG TPA: Flp pilus assembly protein CpaB [Candidatus Limnocylindrales bacterium]|nr:Flp pilus assembly protein CpaB [Candidatus Limnocylindrales bacterium]